MEVDYTQDQSTRSAQHKLAVQLLQPLLARRRPARVLLMKHADAGDLRLELANTAQMVRLSADVFAENELPILDIDNVRDKDSDQGYMLITANLDSLETLNKVIHELEQVDGVFGVKEID